MRPKLQKKSAYPEGHLRLKLAGRINETQILQTQCSNICKLNYPVCKTHRIKGMNSKTFGLHAHDSRFRRK